jgi:hypothetical protein
MTVKELIALLEKMPKNAKIITPAYATVGIDRHDGMPIYEERGFNILHEVEKIDKKTVKIY